MERLEITVIHWARQIKEVVSNPEMAHHMDNTGPLEEIEVRTGVLSARDQRSSLRDQVWRSRTVDLSGISEQLNRPEVKRIMEILKIAGSSYVKDFDDQAAMIQTGANYCALIIPRAICCIAHLLSLSVLRYCCCVDHRLERGQQQPQVPDHSAEAVRAPRPGRAGCERLLYSLGLVASVTDGEHVCVPAVRRRSPRSCPRS